VTQEAFLCDQIKRYLQLGFDFQFASIKADQDWFNYQKQNRFTKIQNHAQWIAKWGQRGHILASTWFRVDGSMEIPTVVVEPIPKESAHEGSP
jgi:hypothetical protein